MEGDDDGMVCDVMALDVEVVVLVLVHNYMRMDQHLLIGVVVVGMHQVVLHFLGCILVDSIGGMMMGYWLRDELWYGRGNRFWCWRRRWLLSRSGSLGLLEVVVVVEVGQMRWRSDDTRTFRWCAHCGSRLDLSDHDVLTSLVEDCWVVEGGAVQMGEADEDSFERLAVGGWNFGKQG